MKTALLFPIVSSILLICFMLLPHFGFTALINYLISTLDYVMSWSVSPIDVALIAIIPWIGYRLWETTEKRTFANQLKLTFFFLLSALVFFTFGFLLIDLTASEQFLLPALPYLKTQPFNSYWSIWFGLSNIFITVLFLINKRQRESEND